MAATVEPIRWLHEGDVQLYWAPHSACNLQAVAFCTDDKREFDYSPFNPGRDFGPLDLSSTVTYCKWVDTLVQGYPQQSLVHLTTDELWRWSNSVTLCGAYLVLAKGYTAEAAMEPFAELPLPPFLDCRGDSNQKDVFEDCQEAEFQLLVIDVLRGLQHARDLKWLDYQTFNCQEYRAMMRPENGDMTWLLQGKAMAFASPWIQNQDAAGMKVLTPEDFVPYFQKNKVSVVIQCNHPAGEEPEQRKELMSYDHERFQKHGIRHVWLPFEDGGCPPVEKIQRFLCTCEALPAERPAFAVHCRSGLGRTATLIGAYAIRHCGFTARSFIGWSRVCRPGTVHGNQQQYLVNLEPYLRMGAPKALSTLNSTEQLELLPRRELRFYALDQGIGCEQTRGKSDEEVIQMILEAYSENLAGDPGNSQYLRPPDPGDVHRILLGKPVKSKGASVSEEEPWTSLVRYLRLLSCIPAWKPIILMVEQLQNQMVKMEMTGIAAMSMRFPLPNATDEVDMAALRQAQQAASEASKEKEEELERVLQQLHSVQLDCSELRLNIAKGAPVETDVAGTVAEAEAREKIRQLKAVKEHLQDERDKEQQLLQLLKQQLNQPESVKSSLDRLRSRLLATN